MVDYTTEFHWLVAHNDLTETEEQQVSRYIRSLWSQFQDQLNLLDPYSVSEVNKQALQLEKQFSRHTNDSSFWVLEVLFVIIQTRLPNSIISLLQILQIKLVNLVKSFKPAKPNPRVWDYAVLIMEKMGIEWKNVKREENMVNAYL